MSDSVNRSKFRVFAATGRYFRVLVRHSLPGLVFVALGIVASLGAMIGILWIIAKAVWMDGQGEAPPEEIIYWLLVAALWLGCATAPPLAAHAAACEQEGRRVGFRDSWSVLWRHLPAGLLILVAQTVIVGLGFVLLIFPAMIASTFIGLAIPARVVEGVGPLKAIARSVELTEGSRWRLFGYFCLAGLAFLLAMTGGMAAFVGAVSAAEASGLTEEAKPTPLYISLNIALAVSLLGIVSLLAWLSALGPAAAFAQVRAGLGARAVSDVFD